VENALWAKDALLGTAETAKDTATEKLEEAKELVVETKDQVIENAENLTGYKLFKPTESVTINLELPKETQDRLRAENEQVIKETGDFSLGSAPDQPKEVLPPTSETINLELPPEAKSRLVNENLETVKEHLSNAKDGIIETAINAKEEIIDTAENLTGFKLVKDENRSEKTEPESSGGILENLFKAKDVLIETAETVTGYKLTKDSSEKTVNSEKTPEQLAKQIREKTLADEL
jgi:uncharacterized protein YbaP (TraB family)